MVESSDQLLVHDRLEPDEIQARHAIRIHRGLRNDFDAVVVPMPHWVVALAEGGLVPLVTLLRAMKSMSGGEFELFSNEQG